MEPEEPENRQENPAGTGPIEHRLIEEKEPSGQTPQRVPDDIRENESGKPDGTGEAGIVREQEEEHIGHDVMKAPDEVRKTVKAVTPAAVTRKENRSKVSTNTTPIIANPVTNGYVHEIIPWGSNPGPKTNRAGSQRSRIRDTVCCNGEGSTGHGVFLNGTPGPDECGPLS
jgi:hypothetical protein